MAEGTVKELDRSVSRSKTESLLRKNAKAVGHAVVLGGGMGKIRGGSAASPHPSLSRAALEMLKKGFGVWSVPLRMT